MLKHPHGSGPDARFALSRLLLAAASAALVFALPLQARAQTSTLPRLKVAENKRFLVTADNAPFF